ncbi:MAG: 2-amino-4-hydroxy-6-hydroxymethyldihydropteridine diphosphokinase [Paludibacter sp.]|jgi:2-amino-4-hydroxy-6-hydroxymethyldihydropteridine diphosphokinase|nr:2-amino-4-hydroxy-6-hydroxymethyldihydropteridine diphosphokinase [Paludibacter sp.]
MKAFIGLGSNLGDREQHLHKAIELIGEKAGRIVAVSSFYYSEPQGFVSENYFVNAALELDTQLSAHELLKALQEFESQLGRTSKSVGGNYSDRIIDLDILTYENVNMDTPELTLPHPRINERDFVLKPLRELKGFSHKEN